VPVRNWREDLLPELLREEQCPFLLVGWAEVRVRQEKATKYSTQHSGQTTRAKPFSKRP
jgi:hypothetical protein